MKLLGYENESMGLYLEFFIRKYLPVETIERKAIKARIFPVFVDIFKPTSSAENWTSTVTVDNECHYIH